jgi:hypothetical protein
MVNNSDDPPCPRCQLWDWDCYQIRTQWYMFCRSCDFECHADDWDIYYNEWNNSDEPN